MENWNIKIIDVGYKLEKDIYIFRKLPNGNVEILGNGECGVSGELPEKPTISLTDEMMQKFADVLADNGYKPKEGFIDGKLQATEKHLKDMRKLLKL